MSSIASIPRIKTCLARAIILGMLILMHKRATPIGVRKNVRGISTNYDNQTQMNPYAQYLNKSSKDIQRISEHWQSLLPHHLHKADSGGMMKHNHDRFFPFDPLASCKNFSCVGGDCGADEAKIICGFEELQQNQNCIVYSIGSNNQWKFELDIINRTQCNVHTFDCTGKFARFHKPSHSRIHFHHICLSNKNAAPNLSCDKSRGICGAMMTLNESSPC